MQLRLILVPHVQAMAYPSLPDPQGLTAVLGEHLVHRLHLHLHLRHACAAWLQQVAAAAGHSGRRCLASCRCAWAPRCVAEPSSCAAERLWQEAAASAGLAEPPPVYSRSSLVAMAGCDSTLQQHARSSASILSARPHTHRDHPHSQALALSPQLTATATGAVDRDAVQLSQPDSSDTRTLAVRAPPQPGDWTLQVREISFSPRCSHLAITCLAEMPRSPSPQQQGSNSGDWDEGDEGDGYWEGPPSDHFMERTEQAELYLLDLATGQAKCVADAQYWLRVTWAPSGDCLAVQTGRGLNIVSAAGVERSTSISYSDHLRCIAWRPDSSGFYVCGERGKVHDVVLGASSESQGFVRAAEVKTPGWHCRAAAFLPCSQHSRLWVALALYRPPPSPPVSRRTISQVPRPSGSEDGYLALQPEGSMGGGDIGIMLAGRLCSSLAVSARHVAVCCGASQVFGAVHIFAIGSAHKQLFLRPQGRIQLDLPASSVAVSSCGLFLAFVRLDTDEQQPGRQVQMQCLDTSAGLQAPSVALAMPDSLHERYPALRWALDSTRLAVTVKGTAWEHCEGGYLQFEPSQARVFVFAE